MILRNPRKIYYIIIIYDPTSSNSKETATFANKSDLESIYIYMYAKHCIFQIMPS